MPPTIQQLNALQPFASASWALWSEHFDQPDCIEQHRASISTFMHDNIQHLKTDVVFLGLNRSRGNQVADFHPFCNFHTVAHRGDRTLKDYLQNHNLTNLIGAFMTDLDSIEVNANGNQINADLNDFAIFAQQLDILASQGFKIICFGGRVFRQLLGFLNLRKRDAQILPHDILHIHAQRNHAQLEIFQVYHYSDRGYNHFHVLQLAAQLGHLN
jgi:hypothetical protein